MQSADQKSPSDILIVLPTYNNAATLMSVIAGAKKHSTDILIVDDGSTDETPKILSSTSDVLVKTHSENCGKGRALLTALNFAREAGYRTVITLDTDGQHSTDDLPTILKAVSENPEHIIMGDRRLDFSLNKNIPTSSKFGRAFSDFWVRLETGTKVSDSQSGFRAYPVKNLPLKNLKRKHYDFEIEILVNSLWSGIKTLSIPITVHYPARELRVTHFHPWRDNFRLTVLHTSLCTKRIWSIIRARDNFTHSGTQERSGSWFMTFFAKHIGLWFCYGIFPFILPFYFFTNSKARNGITGFYAKLGMDSRFQRLISAFQNYYYFVLSMLDKLARAQGVHAEIVPRYSIPSLLNQNSGAIMIGAHFGDWSFCGAAFGKKSTRPVAVVLNPLFSAKFNRQTNGLGGLKIIDASRPGIEILLDIKSVLDTNGVVCFLGDRMGAESRTEVCEFLETPANFPLAPFEIALRLQVPVYNFYCIRSSTRRNASYLLSVDEIWAPSAQSLKPTPQDLLRIYVRNLESYVRKTPNQWFNFFDFWRPPTTEPITQRATV